jgi:hypothetical protein
MYVGSEASGPSELGSPGRSTTGQSQLASNRERDRIRIAALGRRGSDAERTDIRSGCYIPRVCNLPCAANRNQRLGYEEPLRR